MIARAGKPEILPDRTRAKAASNTVIEGWEAYNSINNHRQPRRRNARPGRATTFHCKSSVANRLSTLMPRFYCNQPLETGMLLALPEAVGRHVQVLRLKEGELITLFNGTGGEYTASLERLEKKQVQVRVKSFSAREAESAHGLCLAQALPEGSKMDWIIEKAVELGVTAIQPLISSRSVVRLSEDRAAKKMQHWRGIMASAAEQCGRNRLPHLGEPMAFDGWINQQDLHRRILLSPRGSQPLSQWARHHPAQALTLIIGPEGGLSPAEEDAAIAQGALCLTLGERVLRTETAGLAAVAALQALWGEL